MQRDSAVGMGKGGRKDGCGVDEGEFGVTVEADQSGRDEVDIDESWVMVRGLMEGNRLSLRRERGLRRWGKED